MVRLLEPHVEYLPVCPEVRIGLGVPRAPIRVERVAGTGTGTGRVRLVQPSTGLDLTERMLGFGDSFADATVAVDGLLLKSRSPSCGIRDVKVYAGEEPVKRTGRGLFASVMAERYPDVVMEDEGRLTDAEIRHQWLVRVFTSARLREASGAGRAGLMAFHARHKLLLMAHSPERQRSLGRLLAGAGGPLSEGGEESGRRDGSAADAAVVAEYRAGVARALSAPADRGAHIYAVQHAHGYFKDVLSGAEKRRFRRLQDDYLEGRAPLATLLAVLVRWAERYDQWYLREQVYLRPYPAALMVSMDSGAGRSRGATGEGGA